MGKPQQWGRIKELFGAALELEPARRAGFLRDACGEDENLRIEVGWLAAHVESDLLSKSPRQELCLQTCKLPSPLVLIN